MNMEVQKFKVEKAKARKLRQSQWWQAKIQAEIAIQRRG